MHRRIDVLTDNLPEVREASGWFRNETRRVAPITLDVMWDHFLSRHWSQLSPDFPLQEFTCYAREQVMTILPDSPPRFINPEQLLMVRAVVGALSRYGFHPERVKRHGKAVAHVWMPCVTPGTI